MTFWSWFPIVILFVLFFMKVPIAYGMLISTAAYYMWGPNSMDITSLVQQMVSANQSFVFLAIPFFTAAGVIFNYSGITRRLLNLANLLVGHMRGGMGQVNIVLSALMGGLSGSANADAAMEAKMLVPEMTKLGYSKPWSCVVTAASSCITPIIPPGIILILYSACSDVSVAKMFYAGYLPGILMMISLMVLTALISKKRDYKPARTDKANKTEVVRALKDGVWALFIPFGLVMGLRLGWFTPTEAGAVCIVYSVLVGKFIYKELKWSDMPAIIKESLYATSGVMFILAASKAFSLYLTWERLPQMVSEFIATNISQPWLFLLVCNILLLIIGFFFDGGAAMILVAPLLVPAAQALGIDLIHFGIVMSINLTLAGITPPFGNMMFVTLSVTDTKLIDYAKEAIPYILVLVGLLLILTYIPGVILFVPNLLS